MNLQLSDHEVEKLIKDGLSGPRKAELSNAIVKLMESEWKKERLIKVCLDVIPKQIFKVGAIVSLNKYGVSTYDCDTALMETQGVIVDDRIIGIILSYDTMRYGMYTVKYPVIKNNKTEITYEESDLNDENIKLAEVFPEYKAGDMIKEKENKDLPF